MPYRRLPNTDNARIRALRTAIDKSKQSFNKIITPDIIHTEAQLRRFESAQALYRESLNTQSTENRKLQKLIKTARLYISHFIQVLNFAVIRNEIKKEAKAYYKLIPDNYTVPDLSSNESLLKWGKNIIDGEQKRLSHGGTPIYNPSIARVNVAYSQFKNALFSQKLHQTTTNRQLESLSVQRDDIDEILSIIWNDIEAAFSHLPTDERLEKCKEYGVVYYLRKGEKDTEENDY